MWGDVAGQFTAPPPTCPCDIITFECNVKGNGITLWNVGGGGGSCSLFHTSLVSTSNCGPGNVFTAMLDAVDGTSFLSTLSGTATPALDGTLIMCFGPTYPGAIVGSGTIQIVGPPPAPMLTCVGLSEDNNVNVTIVIVSWTPRGGYSADFYLISITTDDPQPPYGGLLNITTASVTQRELTGFQAGYEYTITIRSANCGSQEGGESEPLSITPQVPATPMPDVCAMYDKENEILLAIQNTWDEVDPLTVSADCSDGQDIRASYVLSYTSSSGTSIATCIVNGTDCSNGVCHHELQNNTADSRCQPPLSQFSNESMTVTVTARNIVGPSESFVSRKIGVTNVDLEVGVDSTNPVNASVECMFEQGHTCTIEYGTDPSYTNLSYMDNSTTVSQVATINLSLELLRNTTYYYTVSAKSGSQCVGLRGTFRTECTVLDLGISAPEDGMMDSECVNRLFMNTLPILNGGVCYNQTIAMSEAVYICADMSSLMGEATRVCQNDGNWNGSTPQCIQATTVCSSSRFISQIFILLVLALAVFMINYWILPCHSKKVRYAYVVMIWWKHYYIPFSLIMNAGLLLLIGFALWITYDVVVTNHLNDSCILPMVKGCLIFQFVCDIITLVVVGAFTIAEIHLWRKLEYQRRTHVVLMVVACVLCMTGVALWIPVGATVAIPPSDINAGSPLKIWQIVALVLGGILLGIVVLVATIALAGGRKLEVLEWKKFLYFFLVMVAAVFSVLGIALCTTEILLVLYPPNGSVCDTCLPESLDGMFYSGIFFTALASLYCIAAMVTAFVSNKYASATYFTVVMVVLLCLSVIGIPLAIALCCFKKMKKGGTGQYNLKETHEKGGSYEDKKPAVTMLSKDYGEKPKLHISRLNMLTSLS